MKRIFGRRTKARILPIIAFVLLLVSLPFVLRSLRSVQKTEAAWYSSLWGYRVRLTIDHTKVTADQTDFPVYVDLSTLPSGFHQHVNQTDGRDIRVTKSDGTTELPREVVFYNASTHKGEIHIKYTGTLSSSTDTSIYIYYGNASTSDYATNATYGAENVWDSNYLAVYHLNEPSGHHLDSTSNNKDSG